jgi:hypothetical protein
MEMKGYIVGVCMPTFTQAQADKRELVGALKQLIDTIGNIEDFEMVESLIAKHRGVGVIIFGIICAVIVGGCIVFCLVLASRIP